MSSVRGHNRLFVFDTANYCVCSIKYGKSENKKRNYKRNYNISLKQALNTYYGQHIAKECRACITHKYFCRVKVIWQKSKTRACKCRCKNCNTWLTCKYRNKEKRKCCNRRDTHRKSVKTVNKVNCIGNANNPQNCNRNTHYA